MTIIDFSMLLYANITISKFDRFCSDNSASSVVACLISIHLILDFPFA